MTGKYAGIGLIPGLLDGTFNPMEHHSIVSKHPESVYYEERDEPSIVAGTDDSLTALAAMRAFTPEFSANPAR